MEIQKNKRGKLLPNEKTPKVEEKTMEAYKVDKPLLPANEEMPPEKILEKLQDMDSRLPRKGIRAAIELLDNYRTVCSVAAINPEMKLTQINARIVKFSDEYAEELVAGIVKQGKRRILKLLANSTIFTTSKAQELARLKIGEKDLRNHTSANQNNLQPL